MISTNTKLNLQKQNKEIHFTFFSHNSCFCKNLYICKYNYVYITSVVSNAHGYLNLCGIVFWISLFFVLFDIFTFEIRNIRWLNSTYLKYLKTREQLFSN